MATAVDKSKVPWWVSNLIVPLVNLVLALLVSVELDEVLSLSDRILVMFDGNIVGERINKDVTDRELGLLMAGVA